MNEVKIQIPDNCELIKDGDTYIVKEKKQAPPRSWKEFCKRYPVKKDEYCIKEPGYTLGAEADFITRNCATWCTSEKEAKAFLALMQLRQLRKAWVGDWEPSYPQEYAVIILYEADKLEVHFGMWEFNYSMSFPTKEMAKDFLNCFRDLCETAKTLL